MCLFVAMFLVFAAVCSSLLSGLTAALWFMFIQTSDKLLCLIIIDYESVNTAEPHGIFLHCGICTFTEVKEWSTSFTDM